MAQLNHTADFNDTEQSFDVVPAGEYKAIIESSDFVTNKAGDGKILKLTYQVIEGNFKGRKIFNNLNIENKSQQAVTISKQALNGICKAVGINVLQDSNQLHNIPMMIDVSVTENATYGKQNKIKKHTGLDGQGQAPAQNTTSAPVGENAESPKQKQVWEQ